MKGKGEGGWLHARQSERVGKGISQSRFEHKFGRRGTQARAGGSALVFQFTTSLREICAEPESLPYMFMFRFRCVSMCASYGLQHPHGFDGIKGS